MYKHHNPKSKSHSNKTFDFSIKYIINLNSKQNKREKYEVFTSLYRKESLRFCDGQSISFAVMRNATAIN